VCASSTCAAPSFEQGGVVDTWSLEPETKGGRFAGADADTLQANVARRARRPDQVVVFSKPGCPFCVEAKALLEDKGYAPIEIPLENKVRGRVIGAVSGKGTAPQVFINGSLIGGLDDLKAHFA
ncbi:hypothetical protein HGQ98_24800, partial [Achromobacter ruhlandii]